MASDNSSHHQLPTLDVPGAAADTKFDSPMQSPQSPDSTHAEVAFGEGYPKQYGSTDKPTAAQSKEAKVDILHPLTSLEWEKCQHLPVGMSNATAVWYGEKLYIGGGWTFRSIRDDARLFVYTLNNDTWDSIIAPVFYFGLTSYHSQLVLVGGREYIGEYIMGEFTNTLWTLNEHGQWEETLPAMKIKRCSACAVSYRDHLLVAGGKTSCVRISNDVEIYNGNNWSFVQPLPQSYYDLKSAIVNQYWYLMGGLIQGNEVLFASLDSLLASCSQSIEPSSVWKRLTNAPNPSSSAAVCGSRLVAVGGGELSTVYAYSFYTNSWIHVGNMPFAVSSTCSVVLPTGELMVVGGMIGIHFLANVLKAKIKVTSYDPDSHFSMSGLSRLEGIGIPITFSLDTDIQFLQHIFNTLVPNAHTYTHTSSLLNAWLSYGVTSHLPPTWKNLLLIIHLLNLDVRIETYLSGAKYQEKQHSEMDQVKAEGEEKSPPVQIKAKPTEGAESAITVVKPTESETTWILRGVEVCGEMTMVVYSSCAQQMIWESFGLKLYIPEDSLPAGMEQCIINIKASIAGQYEFPENYYLTSAIFWLYCETVHKFSRPITVEIQHCAKSENVKLNFVRAICSQKQLPYTFKQLPGGNFTSHSSCGVIELNSFSGVGVIQEGCENREYCSRLFYMHVSPLSHEIHFVVTWNVEAHLTVIEKNYSEKGALAGPHQLVEFESDMICLDIPMEGISNQGWNITPLIRPVVTKKQVDNFREGKLTPCCQLLAEFEITKEEEYIPTLKLRVNLKGAKYPNDIFVINIPARCIIEPQERSQTSEDLGPPSIKRSRPFIAEPHITTQCLPKPVSSNTFAGSSSADKSTGVDAKLDLDSDCFKATTYLQKLDKDHIIDTGGALGLYYSKLQKMTKYPNDMVAAWLRREDSVMSMSGEPTWRTLVEALRRVGQEGTARDIEAAKNN